MAIFIISVFLLFMHWLLTVYCLGRWLVCMYVGWLAGCLFGRVSWPVLLGLCWWGSPWWIGTCCSLSGPSGESFHHFVINTYYYDTCKPNERTPVLPESFDLCSTFFVWFKRTLTYILHNYCCT